MRFLGRKWQKKSWSTSKGNKISRFEKDANGRCGSMSEFRKNAHHFRYADLSVLIRVGERIGDLAT